MRDMKFRAWHKGYSKWINGSNSFIFSELDCGKNIEVMQFTGFQDNKGNDIYEYDIVKDHVGTGTIKYSDSHAAFRVSYGDGIAKWFIDYTASEIKSIQVIGNIHQNPELVKRSQGVEK